MGAHEALLQRREKNCIGGIDVQVRMGRPLFADFIAHTPVLYTGEADQGGLDDFMGETMCIGVVKGQLILTGLFFCQKHSFQ